MILASPYTTQQSRIVRRGGLEGQGDPRIAADIAEFALPPVQMSGNDLVALQTDPDDRDLRGPILVDGDEMSEGAGLDEATHRIVEHGHAGHSGTVRAALDKFRTAGFRVSGVGLSGEHRRSTGSRRGAGRAPGYPLPP